MIKIDKNLEYSLIILKHMKDNLDSLTSARDISLKYNLSFDMIAKVMRRLTSKNILVSKSGNKGGYFLKDLVLNFTLLELEEMVNGPLKIKKCIYNQSCNAGCIVKDLMLNMNLNIIKSLSSIKINEIIYKGIGK